VLSAADRHPLKDPVAVRIRLAFGFAAKAGRGIQEFTEKRIIDNIKIIFFII